jgi:hypothetical protein
MQVKPTDKHVRANFPFRSKSLYSKDFTSKNIKRHQSLKSIDQISLGKLWMGESTYNQSFQKPKRDLLDPLVKHIDKINKTLEDKLRLSIYPFIQEPPIRTISLSRHLQSVLPKNCWARA